MRPSASIGNTRALKETPPPLPTASTRISTCRSATVPRPAGTGTPGSKPQDFAWRTPAAPRARSCKPTALTCGPRNVPGSRTDFQLHRGVSPGSTLTATPILRRRNRHAASLPRILQEVPAASALNPGASPISSRTSPAAPHRPSGSVCSTALQHLSERHGGHQLHHRLIRPRVRLRGRTDLTRSA